jgi:tRNA (adenine22-N1)-methyltransferase
MQLSKRLHAVASLVTPGNRVADVGCDHAYTSIYLAENNISPHIIAMDVNQGPIDRAKENIIKYGYEDLIDTRKSNGLEKLEQGEAQTILIAGMGGGLTIQILTERMEIVQSVKELILQPQSDIHRVRSMLSEYDFVITKEDMLKEDGKYYVMMKAEPRHLVQEYEAYMLTRNEHYYFGRLLLEQQNPVLSELLLWDKSLCENIIRTLGTEQTENSLLRQKELTEKIELINGGLGYYK